MSSSDEGAGGGPGRSHVLHGLAAYAVMCVGGGVLGGALWRAIVRLPLYRLDSTNHALIAERGLAAIFSMDAWYALIGAVIGVVLGGAAWQFFRRFGWRVVVIAVLGSLLAALACWGVGVLLGPGSLEERLATAQPGDYVPVDIQLHAYTTMALWPFGAVLPVFLMSSLARPPRERTVLESASPEVSGSRGTQEPTVPAATPKRAAVSSPTSPPTA